MEILDLENEIDLKLLELCRGIALAFSSSSEDLVKILLEVRKEQLCQNL